MMASRHVTGATDAPPTPERVVSSTRGTRDDADRPVRPDEPGFELTEEWLNHTPWSSHGFTRGETGNDFDTLERREITAVFLASSLIAEAAHTLPWGSEWRGWLEQVSAHVYRAARSIDVARSKRDASIGYLLLPDADTQRLQDAGIATIPGVVDAIEQRGGLQWIDGVGPSKEREVIAAVEQWKALPADKLSADTRTSPAR